MITDQRPGWVTHGSGTGSAGTDVPPVPQVPATCVPCSRIRGELLKLGIKIGSDRTVNTLKKARLPISPHHEDPTWHEFIASHAETLWACDFFRHRIVTAKGVKDAYLLVFVNVATRVAIATKYTLKPDKEWVAEQASTFKSAVETAHTPCNVLTRDRDTEFG